MALVEKLFPIPNPVLGPLSPPAWIANIQDPSLKADFTAIWKTYATTGAPISESDMQNALTDLVVENASNNHAALSASQFSDLQSIAKNIGSLGASSYLEFITNAFVNGNPANATYTGGAATASALGNLAAGYGWFQQVELVSKWFDGMDLPSDSVTVDGKSFTVAYPANNANPVAGLPLWGPNGPSMSDVNQGRLGDCYLMAPLAEIAQQDPSAIENMITDNGNGTYGVRFYVDGQARYVTVDNQLADNGTVFNRFGATQDLWASLIESAYAQIQDQGDITGNSSANFGNSFDSIGDGGSAGHTLEEITDASAITYFDASGSSWTEYVDNQSFAVTQTTQGLSTGSVLSTIAADLLVGNDVILESSTNAYDANGNKTLVASHDLSIYGYDASTGMLEVRNPWGTIPTSKPFDETFEISLNTLLADGDKIVADNVGTATNVSGASVVAAAALQTMSQVTSFSVTDSVANVEAGLGALAQDSKLTSLTVNGTSQGDFLNLTGFGAQTNVDMNGDSALVSLIGFVASTSQAGEATATGFGIFDGPCDTIELGSGHATIDNVFSDKSGVEVVDNFNPALDALSISLNGGAVEQTFVNGGDWVSSTTDLSHGVMLSGVTTLQSVTVSNGIAKIV